MLRKKLPHHKPNFRFLRTWQLVYVNVSIMSLWKSINHTNQNINLTCHIWKTNNVKGMKINSTWLKSPFLVSRTRILLTVNTVCWITILIIIYIFETVSIRTSFFNILMDYRLLSNFTTHISKLERSMGMSHSRGCQFSFDMHLLFKATIWNCTCLQDVSSWCRISEKRRYQIGFLPYRWPTDI